MEEEDEQKIIEAKFAVGHADRAHDFILLAEEELSNSVRTIWSRSTWGSPRAQKHHLWADYMSPRAYSDLTIYTVHPQPEIGGIRSLVLIVVVENPDHVHPDIRIIFVIPKARVSVAGDLTA